MQTNFFIICYLAKPAGPEAYGRFCQVMGDTVKHLPVQQHLYIKRRLRQLFAQIYFIEHTRHQFA